MHITAEAPVRQKNTRKAAKAAEAHTPAPAEPTKKAAESTNLSTIVLSLRPEGAKFNGNRIERAQEAGFGWLKNSNLIGLADPDTGDEIARHVVHHTDETMGRLKEIQVHIDPESCSLRWKAGTLLMNRLQKYAVLIGACICDGLGQRLDDEAVWAIAKHIDSVMEKRTEAERQAHTVTLPSGERRQLSELSFAYEVVREAGAKKGSYRRVRFDAPALHYYEGRARGMQMAGEIVQFYRRHKEAKPDLRHILREAMQSYGRGYGDYDKASVANVASGFFEVVETLIELGSRHLNPAWLEHKIKQSQESHREWSNDRDERKAEFVERMRIARAAAAERRSKAQKTKP